MEIHDRVDFSKYRKCTVRYQTWCNRNRQL